ncbi:NuoM family protein [Buchnera aphidicola]|uniref:complex I subunit 4 family protein n=1 Tax=Buchnera aphidicola TaxID=9 RepID=UPI0034648D03
MLLFLLIIIPLLGGLCCGKSDYFSVKIPRLIALTITTIVFCLSILLWLKYFYYHDFLLCHEHWNEELLIPWIPRFGISFHLAIDGLSLAMIILSSFLGIISVLCSWNNVKEKHGFFYFNLMFILFGTIGVLLSIDLFLFFCFWEITLIPMYFLIVFWGDSHSSQKTRAFFSNKFLIYTQLSSLIMLFSIILFSSIYYYNMHIWTFDYNQLLHFSINYKLEFLVMLGFFIAFAVKMPVFPFHSWLPDAHNQSPVAGSVDLSGMLIKLAAYGLLRFNINLFKYSSEKFSMVVMLLGIMTVFYGSWMAFSQNNIKKILAYSSISHMGFILTAIYSQNEIAYQGAIIQMISSGLSSSALFILFSQLYVRFKTKNIIKMGGLSACINWIPGFFLFFIFSNLGIPGTVNFIGEFTILLGLFHTFPIIACILVFGLLFSAIYSLNIMHKVFYGPLVNQDYKNCTQINNLEFYIIIVLIVITLLIGLFPQNILNVTHFLMK